jgi:AGCS family alanine or glycine:cation symporter
MYALERSLGWKPLAVAFSAFTACAAFGIGNSVQSNAISLLFNHAYGIPEVLTGAVVAAMAALVILFGVKGIGRFCTAFVPPMALLYVIGCCYILIVNREFVWDAMCLICRCAFTPSAAGGGFAGTTIMLTARYGIARGLFSNESGMGSAPIEAAAAKTEDPVRQAMISSTGTFWDTVVICALTGLVLVSSILAYPDIDYSNGGAMTRMAFEKIPVVGAPLLTFGIVSFAFSTILGWCYYGERAMEYLTGKRFLVAYRVLYIAVCFAGAVFQLNIVWNLADLLNGLMAIPNLISLLCLSGVIVSETKKSIHSTQ